MNINWKNIKRIHFVGIKGVAMAALAVWVKEAGYNVTGSDMAEAFPTDEVLAQGGITALEFSPKNITNIRPDLVIYTGAHGGRDNPEVVEATALGIPVLPHGQALGMVMADKKQISVA
ncbi:MAG: Mur ligase domain-containing protein, partial [Candidatus Gottesmanbacteria bacterium]|nr:Mur ligase domain-containing protein [Candidatus Gottesmanbacteria bacterium]